MRLPSQGRMPWFAIALRLSGGSALPGVYTTIERTLGMESMSRFRRERRREARSLLVPVCQLGSPFLGVGVGGGCSTSTVTHVSLEVSILVWDSNYQVRSISYSCDDLSADDLEEVEVHVNDRATKVKTESTPMSRLKSMVGARVMEGMESWKVG